MLPASLSTSYMYEIAGFRSKQRIPVVTYFHQPSQCVLVRAAQPLVGLLHRHCTEDVALLNWYRAREHATDDETKLYIFDLRSYAAAVGNGVGRGGGKEDVSLYICTELVHSNLENIHAIRNSFNLLCDVVAPGSGEEEIAYLYYTKLDESCWLKYIRAILDCSVKVAERIHLERTSVVVRCSDGWDRTPQVCSLVEIMLDPYYRTLEGIAVLIEKEWCGFGHKFHDRCGHAVNHSTNPDEKSPIFVQFLDCVMQLVTQFPNSFEFNGFLLVFLADHVNSALFGNFLGNSDKERRVKLNVHRLTQSVWSHVYEHSERFVNEDFEPYFDCIWPSTSVKQVRLWDRFYGRWDHKLHPSSLNAYDQWHDDW